MCKQDQKQSSLSDNSKAFEGCHVPKVTHKIYSLKLPQQILKRVKMSFPNQKEYLKQSDLRVISESIR